MWLVLGQHKPATTTTMIARGPVVAAADTSAASSGSPAIGRPAGKVSRARSPARPERKCDAGVPTASALAPTAEPAVAPAMPAELRRAVRDAIAPIPCALASGDVIGDGNTLELRAIVAANSEAGLRAAVAKAVPMLAIDWHIGTFNEPYPQNARANPPACREVWHVERRSHAYDRRWTDKAFGGRPHRSPHQRTELSFARSIG